jgi:hypothetical protein
MTLHPASELTASRAEGHESLSTCRRLVETASNAIAHEPNRMGAWRLVGALLDARKAFQSHMALCRSSHGPLVHIGESSPRLQPAVHKVLDDHRNIIARFDDLIALASREKATNAGSARRLRVAAVHADAALAAYERRFHDIVYEWSNRDLGGEAG